MSQKSLSKYVLDRKLKSHPFLVQRPIRDDREKGFALHTLFACLWWSGEFVQFFKKNDGENMMHFYHNILFTINFEMKRGFF